MLGQTGRLTENLLPVLKLNRAPQADDVAKIKTQQDLNWDACRFIGNPIHPRYQIILVTIYQKLSLVSILHTNPSYFGCTNASLSLSNKTFSPLIPTNAGWTGITLFP